MPTQDRVAIVIISACVVLMAGVPLVLFVLRAALELRGG